MLPSLPSARVWFVCGSQALYGESVLRQVADDAAAIVDALNATGTLGASVELMPVQQESEGIRRLCLDARADDRCLGVIAWMHTFSPAKEWIAGLEELGKPLLHLHTQANRSLPWSTIDMDFMNLNQAAHGDREFGFLLSRLGIRHKIVAGYYADATVIERIAQWIDAARGWAELRRLKVVRFGDNMRGVAVTEGDKVAAQAELGASVNTYPVTELAAAVAAVADTEVDALVSECLTSYHVADDLRVGGPRHESLRYALRIEVALRRFLDHGGFAAFTTNFEDLGELRQLPGLAVQRLMADGYGFGGEGDWKTAILLRLLKVMGSRREGGTSFMEDYTYHLGPGVPKILGAHMLEVCPSIAAGRPSCEIHPLSIGGREDPVRLVFDALPGAGTVVGLIDVGDRFRLIANDITVVPPDEPLPRLPVARAVWEPAPSLAESAESWLAAGGPHHTVLTTSVPPEVLADFAEIAGIELIRIGAGTTSRAIRQELFWNQAAYGARRRP